MLSVSLQAFEYAQHLLGWLTISTVCHQFGVAQNSVEWRSQFVTHIGEELRFVLARDFELATLVLDFVEQPHVLNSDHSLVSESLNQFNLFFRKRTNVPTINSDYANQLIVLEHWHGGHASHSTDFGSFLKFEFWIIEYIRDLDGLLFLNGSRNGCPASDLNWVLLHEFFKFLGKSVAGDLAVHLIELAVDRSQSRLRIIWLLTRPAY